MSDDLAVVLATPARRCLGQPVDLFFRDDDTAPALTLCQDCPVQVECLTHALEHSEQGVWGGTTEGDRAEIRVEVGLLRQPVDPAREDADWLLSFGVNPEEVARRTGAALSYCQPPTPMRCA